MSKGRRVLVTGDVIIDHHLYRGHRHQSDSEKQKGTFERRTKGGAVLMFNLLANAFKSYNKSATKADQVEIDLGWENPFLANLPPHLHRYGVWEPAPDEEKKHFVWRLTKTLGYGELGRKPDYARYKKETGVPDILFLNDNALGFRHTPPAACWPAVLRQQKTDQLKWIVYKMSKTIGHGNLWLHLSSVFKEKTIVIVSINDIRNKGGRITHGFSWDKTILELTNELLFNPALSGLLSCRHLVVRIGMEGAVWISNDHKKNKHQAMLIFDPAFMEDEWGQQVQGYALGYMSCFAASVAYAVIQSADQPGLLSGIMSGLSAMRKANVLGHGRINSRTGFPYSSIAKEMEKPAYKFTQLYVPLPSQPGEFLKISHSILVNFKQNSDSSPKPLYGLARRIALFGLKEIKHIPYARFGKRTSVDRQEIECLRNIKNMIEHYVNHDKGKRPLCIAVFGPPGAGKSFGVKQIAKGILGKDVPFLEFNLSQFTGPEALPGAFHQIRDKVLEGIAPVVFWDEFDSREYFWLQYLLSPMQDGHFLEGQISHPIGKCIFVFAGGTSCDMAGFGPLPENEEEWKQFKLKKGPDFKSRLSVYLNELGPNPREKSRTDTGKSPETTDVCFPIRRALLLRSELGLGENEPLNMDAGVLSAFLETKKYRHGARSLSRLINHCTQGGRCFIRQSDLPVRETMELFVDYNDFLHIIQRDMELRSRAKELAPFVHECYLQQGEKVPLPEESDKKFKDLSTEKQEDNIAAAYRIPDVLSLIGLKVVPETDAASKDEPEIPDLIETNIELLAEAEHNMWMEYKIKNGWEYGEKRNDEQKIHDCLVPYEQLSEKDKDKDRNSVRNFSKIVHLAKFRIVSFVKE
ncbi:AAA family ATPase [candidate division KSB1 bacterium]|nr:AAA family ATPase [candidate division KSB1 bacterium]